MPKHTKKQTDFEFRLTLDNILIRYDPAKDQTVVEVTGKMESHAGKVGTIRMIAAGDKCNEIAGKLAADPRLSLVRREVIPGGMGHA